MNLMIVFQQSAAALSGIWGRSRPCSTPHCYVQSHVTVAVKQSKGLQLRVHRIPLKTKGKIVTAVTGIGEDAEIRGVGLTNRMSLYIELLDAGIQGRPWDSEFGCCSVRSCYFSVAFCQSRFDDSTLVVL